jgi:hypothetical protein
VALILQDNTNFSMKINNAVIQSVGKFRTTSLKLRNWPNIEPLNHIFVNARSLGPMCLATHAHCVIADFAKYCAICNDSMITNFGTDLQTSQITEKKERERKQNHTNVK